MKKHLKYPPKPQPEPVEEPEEVEEGDSEVVATENSNDD